MAKEKTINLRNPFVYQGYVSPTYFCDRTEETEELISNLQNGRNTVLISPLRIGKTGHETPFGVLWFVASCV